MRAFVLTVLMLAFFSCKKDKKDATPTPTAPQPVQTGTVKLNITSYDSLGDVETDRSGIAVSLYQTNFTGITTASGDVVFRHVPYGTLIPTITKSWYEGAPVSVHLGDTLVADTIPCARYSAYRLKNPMGYTMNDSLAFSFQLDRPVPSGKFCRLAILFSNKTVTPNTYTTIDTIRIYNQNIVKMGLSYLPNLKSMLDTMQKFSDMHILAIPVSYGLYKSNLTGKTTLLGENVYTPDEVILTKNW